MRTKRPGISKSVRDVIYVMSKGVCALCGQAVEPTDAEIDHIVPVSRGGAHDASNWQLTHGRCNQRKGPHPGRPPRDERSQDTARVDVRVTPELRRAIRMRAGADDLSMGEWVRRLILRELAPPGERA